MLSAVLFSRDQVACRTIEQKARESGEVCIYKTMSTFPTPYELTRLLHAFNPDLVFLELRPNDDGRSFTRQVRLIRPECVVMGCGDHEQRPQTIEAAETGGIELLPSPLTLEGFQASVSRAVRNARPGVHDNLLVFLPAKAGSGSTTVASNVAGALARDLAQRVLLLEGDLHSGLLNELLRLNVDYSLAHALENVDRLDGTLWGRIVAKAHGLDVLPALRSTVTGAFSWTQYHQLLQFVRPRYDTVIVDMPELVDGASAEFVQRASRVFIVCTPELPSLLLARQRRKELTGRGVPYDRIDFILNRWNRRDTKITDVEEFLERPLAVGFENDYHSVHRAITEGRLLGPKSELGRAFTAFASRLAGAPAPATPKPRFGFLEPLLSR